MRGAAATGAAGALLLLALVNLLNFMDRMILAAVVEPLKAELGLSDTQLGLLTGFAFALTYVTAGIPVARIADRVDRRVVIAACLAAWSLMTAACGLARSFGQLLAARAGVAIGESGCIPAAHSLIADLFPAERRGSAMAVFTAGSSIGILAGFVAAGALQQVYGWRATFLILGVPGLALALLLRLRLPEPRRSPRRVPAMDTQGLSQVLRTLLATPSYLWLVSGATAGVFLLYGISQWMPALIVRVHGVAPGEAAMMFGLAFGIAGLAGMLGGGWLSDRLSRRDLRWQTWLPAVMYPCSAPFYAAALLAPSANMMIGALSVASLVASAGAGAQFAALMLVVRPGQRATAAAITMFIASAIGMGGAPTLIGVASDLLNPGLGVDSLRWALLGALAVTLVAGGSFFKAGRRLLGDAAAAMPAGPVVEEVRYAT